MSGDGMTDSFSYDPHGLHTGPCGWATRSSERRSSASLVRSRTRRLSSALACVAIVVACYRTYTGIYFLKAEDDRRVSEISVNELGAEIESAIATSTTRRKPSSRAR